MSDLTISHSARPGSIPKFRLRERNRSWLSCEALETRQLLSTTTSTAALSQLTAQPNLTVLPLVATGPTGLTPQQIASAYGVNQIAFSGGKIVGNGAGQTIAIVTAYNDPNISSDLAAFDKQFGLSNPALTVDNLGGSTTDPGWALETSLDVEWAHSLAPGANILLVEAASGSLPDLFSAVSTASQQPGVSVVSMSWGTSEFWGESSFDSLFTTPAGHTGVTYVAASGDSGAWSGPMYPSVSPNVLAVGGTSLTLGSNGGYGSESGWSGSTGGFSGLDSYWWTYESQPSYQNAALQAAGLNYGVRTTPDVSFNADPNSGVAVYDSVSYSGQSGWFQVGGTSAAAPAWAGLIAVADQGLATGGKGPLSGTQAQTQLYSLPSSDFHNITSGFNGYFATTGYNLVTGLGSPNANAVIAGLLSANGVSEGAVASQVTATTPTSSVHHTSTRFEQTSTTSSAAGGTVLSSPVATVASASSQSPGSLQVQALDTQAGTTQAQPVALQVAGPALLNSSTASPTPLGQSLTQQYTSPSGRSVEQVRPSRLEDTEPEAAATPAAETEVPAAEQQQVPKEEQQQAPQVEAPAVAPPVAPDQPMSSLWMDQFDLALAEVGISMAARRLDPMVSISTGVEKPKEAEVQPESTMSLSALVGGAMVAGGAYRLVLGRSDRIRRRWLPGRFPGI